jgi:hypothetical protein
VIYHAIISPPPLYRTGGIIEELNPETVIALDVDTKKSIDRHGVPGG